MREGESVWAYTHLHSNECNQTVSCAAVLITFYFDEIIDIRLEMSAVLSNVIAKTKSIRFYQFMFRLEHCPFEGRRSSSNQFILIDHNINNLFIFSVVDRL